jgi:hypothetical protein
MVPYLAQRTLGGIGGSPGHIANDRCSPRRTCGRGWCAGPTWTRSCEVVLHLPAYSPGPDVLVSSSRDWDDRIAGVEPCPVVCEAAVHQHGDVDFS